MRRLNLLLLFVISILAARAAEQFVTFSAQPDALPLAGATIAYSQQEYEGVVIAIRNLQTDMERVMGRKPAVTAGTPDILIGTIGRNKDIDRLKLADLKGCREKFIITTQGNQIVIAGSDRRGTIYGIYELCRQLGV